MCKCNNGKTEVEYLTLVPGGTAADATYQLSLIHYTCGNRKICADGYLPVAADLRYTVQGVPQPLGNDTYCCDVLITGTCTYMPYRCGDCQCGCNQCPVTDNIYTTVCVPCSTATVPTITGGTVVATPTNLRDCCRTTNAVAITTSFNVAAAAGASTTTDTTASGD